MLATLYWPATLPGALATLCDVSAPAVEASRATLAANGIIEGEVFASNVFSG